MARVENFPRETCHHFNRIRAANADGARPKTATVRRVRVSANHQRAGEGVVFERDLVDDAATGAPESRAELCRCGAQEVIDLAVFVE